MRGSGWRQEGVPGRGAILDRGLEGACVFFLALNFQVSLIGPVRCFPQAAGVGTSLQSGHELCLKGPA